MVAKAYPEERVGVFARRGGRTAVVEYSELDPAVAASQDPGSSALLYNWSNVCMHFFRVAWLRAVAEQLRSDGAYHIARKSIPSKDGPVPVRRPWLSKQGPHALCSVLLNLLWC